MPQLPRTLAALHDPRLLETIREELTPGMLPLEAFLERGGWPEAPRLSLRGVREHDGLAEILLTVEFIEQCPAACPASARPEVRTGYLLARIRKNDGVAEIVVD